MGAVNRREAAPLVVTLVLVLAACSSGDPAPDGAPPVDGEAADGEVGADASVDASAPADWIIRLDRSRSGGQLSPALLGHYDLSGALFDYDEVSGLPTRMNEVGFAEWRVGAGRWEIATRLLPALTDGTSCAAELVGFPAAAFAQGSSDLDLLPGRDWFTYTDGTPVTLAMTADDSRYDLTNVRDVIDTALLLGAAPCVSIDLMPRALSVNQTPTRTRDGPVPEPCRATFSNGVSNARPADPGVFAAAAAGLVERVVEGSGGEPGRPVVYWEVWNEPETPQFWDKRHEPAGGLDEFFKMAVSTLLALDAYRASATLPAAQQLRFGLGSFVQAATAEATIKAFDTLALPGGGRVPLDFVSFHAYANDPQSIVADIERVAAALRASTHYQDAELVLAEWGPSLDGQGWDDGTLDVPLLVSTVVALGAAAGLDRAHHAIFWDFYAAIVPFGLLDHDAQPKPLYHAYRLLAAVVRSDRQRLEPLEGTDGRLDGGQGALLAAKSASGAVHVLLVNRGLEARSVRVELDGQAATPVAVQLLDSPQAPPRDLTPATTLQLPARSIAVLELE